MFDFLEVKAEVTKKILLDVVFLNLSLDKIIKFTFKRAYNILKACFFNNSRTA